MICLDLDTLIIGHIFVQVVQILPLGSKLTLLRGSKFYIELYKENFEPLLLNH